LVTLFSNQIIEFISMDSIIKQCRFCGKDFEAKRSDRIFCSKLCGVRDWERRSPKRAARPEHVRQFRRRIKLKAIEYKGGKCVICGYHRCITAMKFHHLDPNTKEFGISRYGVTRSWEAVKAELDKCILVCGNCHDEIHEGVTIIPEEVKFNVQE